ncbi:sugar ABC transporter substrate-binding protein [Fervidibacillus halotolerans]|uniref:Extracellular solute-binding protein n=1 Tax=Fervidibacillus halotolerans TaxID=2980027 RepID=A0A9E8S029_9BACI|nr:extracellular solute-binding protein [Fervidibacillus halotolerans]WAA13784.1 extracellular solute-binding protein [Fervidibacillus halotolerans]
MIDMFRRRFISVMVILLLIISGCNNRQETSSTNEAGDQVITIRAQTFGDEQTRIQNLEEAAKELNEQLKAENKKIQVKLETSSFDGSWEEYRRQFILAFKSKNEPDIFLTGHEDIAWLAKGDYILPLDELKDSEAYRDVYPTLWESVTWNGHIWGALQDTEARPIFYRKDVLKQLGWTDEEIESLPEKVKNGEFTVDDMTRVAKEAIDQGLVQWGILHRPVNGPEFHMIAKNFGAQLYDPKEDKLVFDKEAILESLRYFESLTQKEKVTPESMTSMEWKNVHQMMIDGKALFWYGGIWNIFNYMDQGAEFDYLMENFGFTLVPATEKGGTPMTLSHPIVHTVSSQTVHPDLVIRLLELVAKPEYQAKHSVETFHLPIHERGSEVEQFKNDEFLSQITYMLDYTTFLPNHADFNKYGDAYFNAIQSVEIGKKTPEEALKDMEVQIQNDLGDTIIIK